MSSAIVRVKRHIDDAPVEALCLAKRRRVGLGDTNHGHDPGFVHDEANAPAGVVLAFVGTARKADIDTVHSVIRRHEGISMTERDAVDRTNEARRRKLEILQEHRKLLKRFQEADDDLAETKKKPKDGVDDDTDDMNVMVPGGGNVSGSSDTDCGRTMKIYDALLEDIIGEQKTISGTASLGQSQGKVDMPVERIDEPSEAGSASKPRCFEAAASTQRDSSIEEFVYDIYLARKEAAGHLPPDHKSYADEYVLTKVDLAKEALMFNDEFPEDPFLGQSDEDSNDENHPKADYPDEEDWYDDQGRERERDSTEEPDESFEEYDELGYLERRFHMIDVDDRAAQMGYGSDDDDADKGGFDHHAKVETYDDCDSS